MLVLVLLRVLWLVVLLIVLLVLVLVVLALALMRASLLAEGRVVFPCLECLPRCDAGIEIGGASLCVLRDKPYMHSVSFRSHLAQVGFRWLHRTLDSLQALHDARSRILPSSIIAGEFDMFCEGWLLAVRCLYWKR
jgi:hypothetical protein